MSCKSGIVLGCNPLSPRRVYYQEMSNVQSIYFGDVGPQELKVAHFLGVPGVFFLNAWGCSSTNKLVI